MSDKGNHRQTARPSVGAEKPSSVDESAAISPKVKWFVSILLLLHLTAVFAEPFRFFSLSSRGTSPAADLPREWLAPYIEFTYLNHGYFFFAPEPGPSHLVDCSFEKREGNSSAEAQSFSVRYPDRKAQWPRLLYHRHFMITENLHQLWVPPVNAALAIESPEMVRDWRNDRRRYEQIRDSMAEHVASRFEVDEVELQRVEHRLLSDVEVFERQLPLNDPSTYVALPDREPEENSADSAGPNTQPPPLLGPLRFPANDMADPVTAQEATNAGEDEESQDAVRTGDVP